MNKTKEIKKRLNYLRKEIKAERISYGEIAELESLKDYIEDDDVLLKEWAGIPEFPEKRYAIVNVNLEYELPDNVITENEIQNFIENVELPKEYVSDSFEFVKVYTEEA